LEELILEHAPTAWPEAYRIMQSLIRTYTATATDERRRAFGYGWEEGYASGHRDGWQERERTAQEELGAKDGQINALKANLIAERERRLADVVHVNDVADAATVDALIKAPNGKITTH
jgi:flagellar biosynthesis/type III secretory pathway protein FliH